MIVQCFLGHMILPTFDPADAPPARRRQEPPPDAARPAGRNSYLVELDGDPVGILLRAGGAFAFHAVSQAFSGLDGARFVDAAAAEFAARRHARRVRHA